MAEGTPENVAAEPRSYTGHYLAPLLANGGSPDTPPPASARVERSRDTPSSVVEAKPRKRRTKVREAAE